MPYTPPSQISPGSTSTHSPTLSRSSSYSEDGRRSPGVGRPTPPRSSSASYLHKHRRSPSVTKGDGAPPSPMEPPAHNIQSTDFAHNGSIRQSPPPVNNLLIPTGAVLSPPDSAESSDGDENAKERGRELEKNWDELQQAVWAIDQKRAGSPERHNANRTIQSTSAPTSQTVSPTALTVEARKISHSRSSTETAIQIPKAHFESSNQTSDSDDEDDEPISKPSLVRKKSGELVKPALRPSSRRRYSSMPGTPTYSKSVHFNDNDNQTRHFLQVDKPIAVSAGSSPVEQYESESEFPFEPETQPEREMKLTNFPPESSDRRMRPIWIERIFLSADKHTLVGVCAVQNIAFQKLVVARFTLDYWKTTSEVVAEFNNDPRNRPTDGCDRFNFHIKLSDQANIDNKTLLLCVRYNVGGQEFWDNNDNTNYQVDFIKAAKKTAPKQSQPNGLGARPLNAIPRSRHSPPATSRGRPLSIDDDFTARFDSSSAYHFGSTDQLLGESPSSIKLKPRAKRGSLFPTESRETQQQPTAGLGGRYDFGASLSAALSNAQDKLGRSSGLMNSVPESRGGSYFGPVERKHGPVKAAERPDALTTDRPAMGSDQYKDLVQRFCYFTSGSGKLSAAPSSPQPKTASTTQPLPADADGTTDTDSNSTYSSDSESSSPLLDGSNRNRGKRGNYSPALSPFVSRAGSPARVTTGGGMGGRAASPISFGYPYHHSGAAATRDGYLSDSCTPTAIQG